MRRGTKVVLSTVVGLVAAGLLVLAGFLLGINPEVGGAVRGLLPESLYGGSDPGVEYRLQQEVLEKLKSTYYKPVDVAALEEYAIEGMLAGLDDPYTTYMDPKEYAAFLEMSSGSYSGVGMVVEMKNRMVTIVSIFKDSPAELAGIRPGDIIVSVDGVATNGEDLDQVVARIKGPEGTTVTLEIYRLPLTTTTTEGPGAGGDLDEKDMERPESATADLSLLPPGGETLTYNLTRKTIEVPVTERETLEVKGRKVALIRFLTFSEGSAKELRFQVKQAVEKDGVAAIILDLRSNGGGLLDEAIDAASIFIPEGVIVSTEGTHSPEQVYYAKGDAYVQVPLYVLVDEYTASAAEIVAGALQDHKRATLIGETTFGKGLVQSIEPLSNGGAVKVTTAVYLTPNGRDINLEGIVPDVVAPDDPATAEVDENVKAALELISRTLSRQ